MSLSEAGRSSVMSSPSRTACDNHENEAACCSEEALARIGIPVLALSEALKCTIATSRGGAPLFAVEPFNLFEGKKVRSAKVRSVMPRVVVVKSAY